jgi:uncharacterized membrane protein YcgQ (UPF0703/DUF1980 family)
VPCRLHPPPLDNSNYTWWRVQITQLLPLLQVSLVQTFFSAPCSQTPSLNIRDQVSHPYRTTGKIVVLYILIFQLFVKQTRRQKVLDWMVASITGIQSPLNLILMVTIVSKYLKCDTFSYDLFPTLISRFWSAFW